MNDDGTGRQPAAKTYRFTDIDQYRSSIRTLDVDFTPLAHKIQAEQTILNLPGCDINFTKSFPRMVDAQLAGDCTAVGFSMDDHDVPIRFNGVDRDSSVIVLGGNGAAYHSVEWVERRYASVVFTPQIRDRGWPDTGANFKMFETSASAQLRLRTLVGEVLSCASSGNASFNIAAGVAAIRDTLLAAVDAAVEDLIVARWTVRANSVRQFKVFQDIRAVLNCDLAQPIYSDELAGKVGVSVRTLHDVVQRYCGMSLHRYLRLRRLWLVRRRLLSGADSVKAIALAFGFWHLGEFSRSYRLHFGEAPSHTLERGRRARMSL